MLFITGAYSIGNPSDIMPFNAQDTWQYAIYDMNILSTNYRQLRLFYSSPAYQNYSYSKKSSNGKTVYWYSDYNDNYGNAQLNDYRYTYLYLALTV